MGSRAGCSKLAQDNTRNKFEFRSKSKKNKNKFLENAFQQKKKKPGL